MKASKGTVTFSIIVPKASNSTKRPHYVSPATQSMTVVILQNGAQVSNDTVSLTATSNGCTSTLASTACSLTLSLNPGTYSASITTYDGAGGNGNILSLAQGMSFTITANTANIIPLTLSGVPAALVVTAGSTADSVFVLAQDIDGNFIFGPGAPTFTASKASGPAVAAISQPTTNAPNTITFALASPAPTPGAETIAVTASYPSGETNACAQSGAVCSLPAAITATYSSGTAFISNYGANNVLEYSLPLASAAQTPSATVAVSTPYPLATDASGDVFAATNPSGPGSLIELSSPTYGVISETNTNGIDAPYWIAVAPNGDAFVANSGNNTVTVYAAPYTGAPIATIASGLNAPQVLAVDSNNTLYVGNNEGNTVTVYPAPYGALSATIPTTSAPTSLLIDNGKLVIGETSDIDVYTLSGLNGSSSPAATFSSGIATVYGLATDANGNLWITNQFGGAGTEGTIQEYTSLAPGATPAVTLSLPASSATSFNPYGIAFDNAGYMYVVDNSGGNGAGGLLQYEPPIINSSSPSIALETTAFNSPYFIAISNPSFSVTP